jgi:hypothetical protein
MNLFHQIASGAKDLMLQQALGAFLNARQITEPETKTTVRLDAKQHRLFLHLYLKGEATPTDLTISYQITPENEIELLGVESAKPWITNVISLLLAQGRIKFQPKDLLFAFPNKAVPLTSEIILSFLR